MTGNRLRLLVLMVATMPEEAFSSLTRNSCTPRGASPRSKRTGAAARANYKPSTDELRIARRTLRALAQQIAGTNDDLETPMPKVDAEPGGDT